LGSTIDHADEAYSMTVPLVEALAVA